MAVTYRPRKRTVPYRTRLTGRLISCDEGFDADRIGPLTNLGTPSLSFGGVRSTSPESIGPKVGGEMDSGFSLLEPRNADQATIFSSTPINTSGAVTFGAWLASSSK